MPAQLNLRATLARCYPKLKKLRVLITWLRGDSSSASDWVLLGCVAMLRISASKNQSEALYGTNYVISVTMHDDLRGDGKDKLGQTTRPYFWLLLHAVLRLGIDKLRLVRISSVLRLEVTKHVVYDAICFILRHSVILMRKLPEDLRYVCRIRIGTVLHLKGYLTTTKKKPNIQLLF